MFLIGGIEVSLANLLSILNKKYEITLLICIHMYELEVMLPKLPQNIKVQYILTGNFMSKNYYRKRMHELTIFYKLIEAVIRPVRKLYIEYKLSKLLKNYDVVVDYALELTKHKIKFSGTKIGYFMYSIEKHYSKNSRNLNLINNSLPSYNKVIVLSRKMLEEAIYYFPEFKKKFAIMYSQIDFENIYALANQGIDLEVDQDFILSVARLEENQKDFTTLIYAYKIFHDKYKHEEKLVIIGSGADEEKLKNLVKDLQLTAQIIFLGHKLNPYPWFKNCKLFILSSKFEGLPTVLIDAMILNKVIISSNCPTGPDELLMDGACGKLVAVGDIDGFANAMDGLIKNKLVQTKYIENVKTNLHRFDISANTKRIQQIFEA